MPIREKHEFKMYFHLSTTTKRVNYIAFKIIPFAAFTANPIQSSQKAGKAEGIHAVGPRLGAFLVTSSNTFHSWIVGSCWEKF